MTELDKVRQLNDIFRQNIPISPLGTYLITAGVAALPKALQHQALEAVVNFTDFSIDNDPYGEHDFGVFELASQRFLWKIDYYDKSLSGGSENPADPEQTTRVLTIMLAEEY